MTLIVVANPKGGVGKSTLSTNLAGYFAGQGEWAGLADIDPQHSAQTWLGLRSAALPAIERWEFDPKAPTRPPKGLEHVVLDTPAAIRDKHLEGMLGVADKIIVPLQPSLFDILATQAFLERLRQEKIVRRGALQIGIVGMRVDARTRSAEQLHRFVDGLGLPVLGYLRDTQNYVQLAAQGLTLWDVSRSRVEKDLEQWEPIIAWAA
jgi:chromosome partitioning protein